MRRSLWATWPFVLLSCVSEALPHLHTISDIAHSPTFRTVPWANTTAVAVPTPTPSGPRQPLVFNSTEKYAGHRFPLLNASGLAYPRPTGLSNSRFKPMPSKNVTNGSIELPTPSNPTGFRPANTAPTGYGSNFRITATGPIPTPTEANSMRVFAPGPPFLNRTASGSPSVPTLSATSIGLDGSPQTHTTPAARITGTAGTWYPLPTRVLQPSPGGSPPAVGYPSMLKTYTRTAVDNTVITVTDNSQASPTNGLTVTTFTAPDGTEKTLSFSAEMSRPTIPAAKSLENSQDTADSTLRCEPSWFSVSHIMSTSVVQETPATKSHLRPRSTPSSTQQVPALAPTQTKSYDTTIYATVAPAANHVPTAAPSNAEYLKNTKQALEIEVLWQIFKLLHENREEYLKHPTISQILPDLLQQLEKTQYPI